MDTPRLPAWIARPPLLPALLREDPLLLRLGSDDGLRLFMSDLTAWLAGNRNWTGAAEAYLADDKFREAAECADRAAQGGEGNEARKRVAADWRAQLGEERSRLDELGSGPVVEVDDDPAVARERRTFRGFLKEAEQRLSALPDANDDDALLAQLRDLDNQAFVDAWEAVDLCAMAHRDLQRQIAQREAERTRQFDELFAKVKQQVSELLFSDQRSTEDDELLIAASRRAKEAREAEDLGALKALGAGLAAIRSGEPVDDAWLKPAPTGAAAGVGVPPTTESTGVRPRGASTPHVWSWSDLSAHAQELLNREGGAHGRDAEPAPEAAKLPPRRWERDDLLGQASAHAGGALAAARDDHAQGQTRYELGQYLLATARRHLLDRRDLVARALFGDLYRWARSLSASSGPEQRAWEDAAAWGILISLSLPALPEAEQRDVVRPDNLAALHLRRIGHVPLAVLDRLGLFPRLGLLLPDLGEDAAARFVNAYLDAYFREVPPAGHAFVEGLLAGSPASLPSALRILAEALPGLGSAEFVEEARDLLTKAASELGSLGDTRDRNGMAEEVGKIRAWFAERVDIADIAGVVEDGLRVADDQLQRSERDVAGRTVALQVVTQEVDLTRDCRFVVTVHNHKAPGPLVDIRVVPRLEDKQKQLIPTAVGAASPIALLGPGEVRETVVPLDPLANLVERGRYLSLQPTSGSTGTPLASAYQRFSVKLNRRPAAENGDRPRNPYVVGNAVSDPRDVVGRDLEVKEILGSLIGQRQDNFVLVLGERRIGKTTVLNAVCRQPEVERRYALIRVDLQAAWMAETPATFLRTRFADPVRSKLEALGVPQPPIRPREFEENPFAAFQAFMEATDRLLAGNKRRLLFAIDEVERLLSVIAEHPEGGTEVLGNEVLAALRSVMLAQQNMAFVLSGVSDVVKDRLDDKENRLFQLAVRVEIDPLRREHVAELVEGPARGVYEVHPGVRDLVFEQTNGHPYLVQRICHRLFHRLTGRGARMATRADLQEVLDELADQSDIFEHLKKPFGDDEQGYTVIKGLAWLQRGSRYVSVQDLERHLRASGASFNCDGDALRRRLLDYARRNPSAVEQRSNSSRHFRLPIGLFVHHLRRLRELPGSLVQVK